MIGNGLGNILGKVLDPTKTGKVLFFSYRTPPRTSSQVLTTGFVHEINLGQKSIHSSLISAQINHLLDLKCQECFAAQKNAQLYSLAFLLTKQFLVYFELAGKLVEITVV